MLGARHAAERSLRCWGAGAGLSYNATRTAIRNLLEVGGICENYAMYCCM